jgi:hypothetical protein
MGMGGGGGEEGAGGGGIRGGEQERTWEKEGRKDGEEGKGKAKARAKQQQAKARQQFWEMAAGPMYPFFGQHSLALTEKLGEHCLSVSIAHAAVESVLTLILFMDVHTYMKEG